MQRFIFPPRASDAIPRSETGLFAKLGFIGELKYNDSHILICIEDRKVSWILDRHGKKPAVDFSDFDFSPFIAKLNGHGAYVFDGGHLHKKHGAIKNTIVIWDVLVRDGKHLLGSTYGERYEWLLGLRSGEHFLFRESATSDHDDFGLMICPGMFMPLNYKPEEWDGLWTMVERVNSKYEHPLLEGIVFKNLNGKLKGGLRERNNEDWLGRSRVETKRHRF